MRLFIKELLSLKKSGKDIISPRSIFHFIMINVKAKTSWAMNKEVISHLIFLIYPQYELYYFEIQYILKYRNNNSFFNLPSHDDHHQGQHFS